VANISISDLHPAGLELMAGSESYLNELSEEEFTNIGGGFDWDNVAENFVASVAVASAVASSVKCASVAVTVSGFLAADAYFNAPNAY
jgi:hypothetical protein